MVRSRSTKVRWTATEEPHLWPPQVHTHMPDAHTYHTFTQHTHTTSHTHIPYHMHTHIPHTHQVTRCTHHTQHIHTCVHMHTCANTCARTQTYAYHIHTPCAHMHVYTCTHHAHTQTCIHRHTHNTWGRRKARRFGKPEAAAVSVAQECSTCRVLSCFAQGPCPTSA